MTDRAYSASWLTARRLGAHGLIVGIALWSIYLWTVATPGLRDRNGNLKGTDFLHFYTLGLVAREHRAPDLYDMKAQSQLARAPSARGCWHRLPAPLPSAGVDALRPPRAFFLRHCARDLVDRLGSNLLPMLLLDLAGVPRTAGSRRDSCYSRRRLPCIFPSDRMGTNIRPSASLLHGDVHVPRGQRDFLAGVILGCLAFKPQLGLAAAIIFLASAPGEL